MLLEDKINRIKKLVPLLNNYCDAYYNYNESMISDKEYDELFDELKQLEEETGLVLSNSPTQNVGFEVKSNLNKVVHCWPPMLSLDKTKEISKIKSFIDNHYSLVMAKLDGLTCRITYLDGKLICAETRGNGIEGEDITHNAGVISGIPMSIPELEGECVIDGEIIVTRANFEKLKAKFKDEEGKEYKNPRNYASGSSRLHNNKECKERKLEFIAWKFVKGYHFKHFASNLNELYNLGFNIIPFYEISPLSEESYINCLVDNIKNICKECSYPIDGCVFGFDEMKLVESFDYTAHHWKAQLAFKFYDDKYDTVIRDIEWTMGKTGVLTPTAIFDTVEIDGTDVGRASLHNVTIMKNFSITKNCSAKVFKANMIIPQIDSVSNDGNEEFEIPSVCPICGSPTIITKDNDSEVLKCTNNWCYGVVLGELSSFVSKQAMNIDGLGGGKLADLIKREYVSAPIDLYYLYRHRDELIDLPGWGITSVDKVLNSIEESKNVYIENFITALNIPNVGYTTAKALCEHFNYDENLIIKAFAEGYDWSNIENFGEKTAEIINEWISDNLEVMFILYERMNIKPKVQTQNKIEGPLTGKTFCITGTFNESRSVLQKKLEELGGTFVSGVSKKTDILFCGEKAGSKLSKANQLGIEVITDIDEWLRNNK